MTLPTSAIATSALVLVALRIRAAELLKRRNFAAQFGEEIKDLKRIVTASGD